MSQENAQHESAGGREPSGEHSEALLQSAIEQLKARGDSARRFSCMSLPAPVFNDLCVRLLDRTKTVKGTSEWLNEELLARDLATIGRSSVERFSDALYEEYRLAQLSLRRKQAEAYVAQATAGDPDAQQMALNTRLTELLTDELLRAGEASEIDTKRLMALMMGARTVAQTAFDKQKMDARIKALEQQIRDRDANIRLKDQKLKQIPDRVKAVEGKLKGIQESLKRGEQILPEIYEAIFQELTTIKSEAGVAA